MVFMNRIFDKIITLFFSTALEVAGRLGNCSFSTFPFPPCEQAGSFHALRLPGLRLQEKFKYCSVLISRFYEHFAAVDVFIAFIYCVGVAPKRLIATRVTA